MTEPAAGRERLGAIDIGSNSIRLVVAEYDPETGFEIIDEVKDMPRLCTRVIPNSFPGRAHGAGDCPGHN